MVVPLLEGPEEVVFEVMMAAIFLGVWILNLLNAELNGMDLVGDKSGRCREIEACSHFQLLYRIVE